MAGPADLPASSPIELALVHPQIAPNTGNVARLCVATGTALHLVRPMGFVLSDRMLRRSAMDYWDRLRLTVHDDAAGFRLAMGGRRLWLTDSSGGVGLWQARFEPGDVVVMGSETRGLPEAWLHERPEGVLRVPQVAGERCLNLSSAAAVVVYEALRQLAPLTDPDGCSH